MFIARLLGLEGKKALQTVSDQLAAADPTTASLAQLQEMEADLDKAGKLLANLRAQATKEAGEAISAKRVFDINVAAAERLQAQLRAPDCTPERKESLAASLNALLNTIQTAKDDWDREQSEADDANNLLTETETVYQAKAKALLDAKTQLASGARELERAKIHAQQSAALAEQAAQVAGLREGTGSSLNSAIDAFNRQTKALNATSEANRMKATALKVPQLGASDDPNIVEALKAVGTRRAEPGDLDARLAELTGKPSQPSIEAPKETPSAPI